MDCLKCLDLGQAFESRLSQYSEARSAAFYQVSTELAARKKVDMERARYDLEEHTLLCPLRTLKRLSEISEGSSKNSITIGCPAGFLPAN